MKGKKWMGSLLIGGVLAVLLSLSAMAAETDRGFRVIEAPPSVTIIPQTAAGEAVAGRVVDGVTTYMGASQLAVSTTGRPGRYMILLVEGRVAAPTEDCVIYYVGQTESTDGTVSFVVSPTLPSFGDLTLFITSNAANTQRVTLQYVSGTPGGRVEQTYTDLLSGSWYIDAIQWAVDTGITKGTSGSTFSPDRPCTRAEAMTFLWRAAGSPNSPGGESFADVEKGGYYEKAVRWAVAQGITKGTGYQLFSPHTVVDRSQVVTFLQRLAGGETGNTGKSFSDVPSGAFYAQAVQWAVARGITRGTGDGTTFSPLKSCTRAEVVTFLYRFFVK